MCAHTRMRFSALGSMLSSRVQVWAKCSGVIIHQQRATQAIDSFYLHSAPGARLSLRAGVQKATNGQRRAKSDGDQRRLSGGNDHPKTLPPETDMDAKPEKRLRVGPLPVFWTVVGVIACVGWWVWCRGEHCPAIAILGFRAVCVARAPLPHARRSSKRAITAASHD